MMRKTLLVGVAALLLLVTFAPGQAHAGTKDLLGQWRVVSMESAGSKQPMPASLVMVLTFASAGNMSLSVRYRGRHVVHRGTYSVKGGTVTMIMDGNTEHVTYVRKGRRLTLFNAKKGVTKRLKKQ